jgi:Na+-driven multidrug efflux pump
MGKELYGVVVVTGSTFEYLSLLRGGIGSALRRYVTRFHHSGDHEQARQYYAAGFWWAALLRTGILLVGIALAGPLSGFLRVSPQLRNDCVLGIALIIARHRDRGCIHDARDPDLRDDAHGGLGRWRADS